MDSDFLKPIGGDTVVQQIIERIKIAMINKELKPGDKIPTENDLIKNFGVGRNSVREAVKSLEAAGVLEVRRKEGTFVTKGFNSNMVDPMFYAVILSQAPDSFADLKEFRKWIDFSIISVAADKAKDKELKLLSKQLDILNDEFETKDIDSIMIADDKFYEIIFDMSNNFLFIEIAKMLRKFTIDSRKKVFNKYIRMDRLSHIVEVRTNIFNIMTSKDTVNLMKIIFDDPMYK